MKRPHNRAIRPLHPAREPRRPPLGRSRRGLGPNRPVGAWNIRRNSLGRPFATGSRFTLLQRRLAASGYDWRGHERFARHSLGNPRRPFVVVRLAYAAVVALAFWVLFKGASPPPLLKALATAVGAVTALALATAAALSKFSIPFLRHACTIAGLWLGLTSVVLPGPVSYETSLCGLAIFWLAGWADDAITVCGYEHGVDFPEVDQSTWPGFDSAAGATT